MEQKLVDIVEIDVDVVFKMTEINRWARNKHKNEKKKRKEVDIKTH